MPEKLEKRLYDRFLVNTVNNYSQASKNKIKDLMIKKSIVTVDEQISFGEDVQNIYIGEKNIDTFVKSSISEHNLAYFYEYWKYTKLYKYSIPLYFEGDIKNAIEQNTSSIHKFDFQMHDSLMYQFGTSIDESLCSYYEEGSYIYLKLLIQKNYPDPVTYEAIDYRYPIILAIQQDLNLIEIRYDSLKFDRYSSNNTQVYIMSMVSDVIKWIKENLGIKIFSINALKTIDILKEDTSGKVKIFKQLMELKSGGSAELQASNTSDCVLPFIGELRELMEENEKLFDSSPEIARLITNYLEEKEATSNYPYIYAKWINPVASECYVVKIIFESYINNLVLLQHITSNCKLLRMERMNNAIEYLFQSGSFVQGKEL